MSACRTEFVRRRPKIMQEPLRATASLAIALVVSFFADCASAQQLQPVIAIHGGAGGSTRGSHGAEREQQNRQTLNQAAKAGQAVLTSGGTAVDAVVAAVKARGLEIVEESHFATEYQLQQLEGAKQREQLPGKKSDLEADADQRYGTIGAVALDQHGNLAAATSTGGLSNKMPGRIGGSPIIGAGNYAENGVAAISAIGTGEMFIRGVASYDEAARIKYAKQAAGTAADAALAKVRTLGGTGGFIVVDWDGNITFALNASRMYRASATGTTEPVVKIFKDE
jgi:isoaspartyl peptidase/L-asparaginase-like protein (Ntn-hydrolase superfamily)